MKITVSYTNKSKSTQTINGEKQEMYTPFVMATGIILPDDKFSNVEVDDGKTTTEWTATFTKNVTHAVLSLAQPMTADDTITVAALTLAGSFPTDLSLTIEMTNNALDETPVWENCTDIQSGESRAFVHHAFTNKTAAKGAAFNYKVTITRGESGTGGNITMIGGAFARWIRA